MSTALITTVVDGSSRRMKVMALRGLMRPRDRVRHGRDRVAGHGRRLSGSTIGRRRPLGSGMVRTRFDRARFRAGEAQDQERQQGGKDRRDADHRSFPSAPSRTESTVRMGRRTGEIKASVGGNRRRAIGAMEPPRLVRVI